MAKKKESSVFKCNQCGRVEPRWLGRCPECGSWNSLEETKVEESPSLPKAMLKADSEAMPLSTVDVMAGTRLQTGISEFDRVLGGGAMLRSAILIGGEPGIGKSTLLLQTAAAVQNRASVLYVSGEESAAQIRARAQRLNLPEDKISVLTTMSLTDINKALEKIKPQFVVVDSIQTVFSPDAGNIPGTINQLKMCAYELVTWVKEHEAVLFLTAHITKEGSIAGPKSLEHIVDTVISFERSSDDVRLLRAQKNRFGSVDELGIFAMDERGLSPIEDPSAMFITKRESGLPPGIAIVPVFEGSRVFMVEIQALTIPTKTSIPRITGEKIEVARIMRIAAILEKRLGIRLSDQDIFVNVAGGMRLTESAIDLALAAAIYSARTDLPCPQNTALSGELSLAGEVRPVSHLKQRIKTALSLGFSRIITAEKEKDAIQIQNVTDLAKVLFEK